MTKTRLGQKVFILVFKMPEDIKVKGDQPLRLFRDKEVTNIFIRKGSPEQYGVRFNLKEIEGWKFALNMDDGIKFDIPTKDIKRLNYKNKFHKFIADQKPLARASFYYPGTARITMFMFKDKADMVDCFNYFTHIYYPKFVLKNNKTLISDAEAVAKLANERLAQLQQEVIDAKKLLKSKKK